jgi:uncharacterized membrane protein
MSRFDKLMAAAAGWAGKLQRELQQAAELGGWPAIYPTILGVAMSSATLDVAPAVGRGLHPKYGAIGFTLIGILTAHLVVLAVALWRRRKVHSFDWILAAVTVWRKLSGLVAVPLLLELQRPLERENPFLALGYAVTSGLLVGYWFAHLGAPARVKQWWGEQRGRRWLDVAALSVLFGVWLAYSISISWVAIVNHLSFNTGRIDLGWYVNLVRRSSIGDFLGCSLCSSGTHINAHFDPILVVISPLFLLHPETETLLVLQALWLGAGVFPLYALSRHQGLGRGVALALCASYCMFPALQGINLFDFHSLALAVPIVLLLWLCFVKGWLKRYFAVLGLLLLVREDAALLSICLGGAFLISGRQHAFKVGVLTVTLAAAYFLVVKGVIMPNADLLNTKPGGQGFGHFYQELLPKGSRANVGDTTRAVLTTVISNPSRLLEIALQKDKLLFIAQLLGPLLLLPLLSRWGKCALTFGFAFTLLATREHVHSIHFQYSSHIVPVLFALLPAGLEVLNARWGNPAAPGRLLRGVAAALVVTGAVSMWKFGGVIPNASFKSGFTKLERRYKDIDLERDAWLKELCRKLPKGAAITASSPMIPHLARCTNVINFMTHRKAEYIVWASKLDDGRSKWTKRIARDVEKGYYKKVESAHGLTLYRADPKNFPKDDD